jgi:hypothetical protein
MAPLLVSALMYKNPFMLYFGQEMGEKGMDQEGFSGRDGRTTIFDYWSVDTVRRWRNKGSFDNALLSREEQLMRLYYSMVLNLKEQNEAFSDGAFYDLMYRNPDLHQQYVFARKGRKNVMLVIANFSCVEEEKQIFIPSHMFDLWNIKEKESCSATNMISGKRVRLDFCADRPISVIVPRYGGLVLKICI